MKKSQTIFVRSAVKTALTLSLVSMAALAQAADLDQILYATPVEQDVFKPVEIGSGWYLRGDIAYVASSHVKGRLKELDFLGSTRFDTKATAAYSGGVGYQFTDNFRGDVTAGYRNMKISDTPVEAGIWEVMANAYYDIGNFSGVTPYIGAGIGMANVGYKFNNLGYTIFDVDNGEFVEGVVGGHKSTRLQWALMAGAAIDVSENVKIDLGYRYSRIASGTAGNAGPLTIADKGLESHQLRAGLRFTTW